jgi:hypothetical protein
MNFEIRAVREVPGVHLQTDPWGWPESASAGENPACGLGLLGNPGLGAKRAAGFDKGLGQACIEPVPADSKSWGRQELTLPSLVAPVPDHAAVAQGIREKRGNAEAPDRVVIQSGDEFATHAVTRIAVRLKQSHRHAPAPQGESQAQAGQPAADDLDRLAIPAHHVDIGLADRRQAIK